MKTHLSPSFFNSMTNYCQAEKIAIESGIYSKEPTKPLLIGGYVDAVLSGNIEKYTEENKQYLYKKDGTLYADFIKANALVEFAKNDPVFLKYISGKQQFKVEGEISGVKYLGYLDSYHPGKSITDLKVVKSIRETAWNNETRQRENFIQSGGILNQMAIYRELIRQMTGDTLPCYIAALSKEAATDKEVIFLPQWALDDALDTVKRDSENFLAIRQGTIEPKRCETCEYCRSTRMIEKPMSYENFFK